jgi:uncharacterized protein YbjT (DUF2867 family)
MILVTGATGLNGSSLIRKLSAKGVAARALVRNPAKAASISSLPNIEIAQGDMARPDTLAEPLQGVDRAMLISSSAPDMVQVQANFIAAAAKAGVKHIVKLSGIMPALDSEFRFARMHAEIEQILEKSGVPFTHLRSGEFMQAYFRQAGPISTKSMLFLPMEDARIASIDVEDLAEVASIVLTSAGHEGKVYPLTGSESLSMADVAERLSTATGKQIRYVNVPPEDAKRAQLGAGMPPYMADALFELFAERRKGKESEVWPTISTVFGLRATTFLEFATRHAAIFRGEQPAPKL